MFFNSFWCFLVLFSAFWYLWNHINNKKKKKKKIKTALMTSFILLLIRIRCGHVFTIISKCHATGFLIRFDLVLPSNLHNLSNIFLALGNQNSLDRTMQRFCIILQWGSYGTSNTFKKPQFLLPRLHPPL